MSCQSTHMMAAQVCCSYDYRVDTRIQNCLVCCVLHVSTHKMVVAGKKADDLYAGLAFLRVCASQTLYFISGHTSFILSLPLRVHLDAHLFTME